MDDLKVTFKNAILAQCHECLGYYADGMQDCENVKCSLYSYMPYRKLEPDLTWTRYHPKRKGRILRSEIRTQTLSDEQKARLAETLRRGRGAK
jgi:hypothetical protein